MDSHDIILAARNKAMNTYPPEDARETLRASIDKAYSLAEVQLPAAIDYERLVGDVTDKILRSYPYMTSQEFALVIEAGVAGELGSRTKPSAAAIFGWLATYMASDIRKEAIRNYRRNTTGDPSATEPTRAEKDEMNRQAELRALRTLWAEYKTHGRLLDDHVPGFVAMAMDRAEKLGLFTIRPEHWKLAKQQGTELCRRRTGLGGFGAALPYEPVFHTKWAMLEMCFNGQMQSGRDLVVKL